MTSAAGGPGARGLLRLPPRRSQQSSKILSVAVELVAGLAAHREWAGERLILVGRSVFRRRNSMSRTSTGRTRWESCRRCAARRVSLPSRSRITPGRSRVDAVERGREPVGVALAPDLAVGDDVDARPAPCRGWRAMVASSCACSRNGSGHPPHLAQAHARDALRQQRAVDEPVGLRIAAHDRGRQEGRAEGMVRSFPAPSPGAGGVPCRNVPAPGAAPSQRTRVTATVSSVYVRAGHPSGGSHATVPMSAGTEISRS